MNIHRLILMGNNLNFWNGFEEVFSSEMPINKGEGYFVFNFLKKNDLIIGLNFFVCH